MTPPLDAATAPPDGRARYAAEIGGAWAGALESVLRTGRLLVAAKAALPHGEFEAMIASDLPFGASTARRLVIVANDKRIANRALGHVLPASWRTLYELTKIKGEEAFEAALEAGEIRPDMDRNEAARLRTAERRGERLAKVERLAATPPDPLDGFAAERRWPVIYADPPWPHRTWSEAGKQKSPENHYPTMSLDALAALPVPALAAPRAALFMWTTGGHLAGALRLMERWGFGYRSHVVWHKTYPDGQSRLGTGYWFRNAHELLLLGVRGDMPAPVPGTQAESVIAAPVGRHSEKPEIFRDMIEAYFPGVAKLELFRRGPAPAGWDAWGNEAGGPVPAGVDPETGELMALAPEDPR